MLVPARGYICRICLFSTSSADGEPVDSQRRLPHAHRNTLSVLAAGANTIIELQIVPDHAHSGEHIGPVADERRALDRCTQLAIFNGIGLACREHEFS